MSNITPQRYRRRVSVTEMGPSKTQQHHAEEVNLPKLMMRYKNTGIMPGLAAQMGAYGDFSEVGDFQESQNVVAAAKSLFEQVPARVRAMYNNDAMQFADAASLPENKEHLADLGFDTSYLPDPPAPAPAPAPAPEPETAPLVDPAPTV